MPNEPQLTPFTHTEVRVGSEKRYCSIHQEYGEEGVTAYYDGKTIIEAHWAYMCEECFQKYGVGLGLGKGQRLIYETD